MLMSTAEPLRVCVYCDTWGQGGIETFLTQTLIHMDTTGLSFHLLCGEKQPSRLDEILARKGLVVEPLLSGTGMGALRKTLLCIRPLIKYCREKSIEIVHLNVFQGVSFLQALALKLSGVHRVIVHSHGAGLRKSRGWIIKYLGHKLCRALFSGAADERWAASAAAGRFLFGHRTVRIIPNGIDVEKFRFNLQTRVSLREKLQKENSLLLGCVGRIDSQKNQLFLLPLLRAVRNQGIPAVLLFIGEGEDRHNLEDQVATLGLEREVIFIGVSDCVQDWMCAMDALLIPSVSEGLSITALEGQASGLPVLCSTGIPQEVQLTQTVQFLPLSNTAKWLEAIQMLPTGNREENYHILRRGAYDIECSASLIRSLYRER